MNRKILSLILALAAMLLLVPCALGESLVNLGSVTAGAKVDMIIPNAAGDAVEVKEGSALPNGCRLETEQMGQSYHHYLRGTPVNAGNYSFDISVMSGGSETEVLKCSLSVDPATPVVIPSANVSCYQGAEATVSVTATAPDGGELSYQWFVSYRNSADNGTALNNAVNSSYTVDTSAVGALYYYCIVSGNNNGYIATATSAPIQVSVTQPVVTAINMQTLPKKTVYTKGETLDTDGLTLSVTYGNGTTGTLTQGFGINPTVLSAVGTQEITVTYGGYNCSFNVTVEDEEVKSIDISSLPARLTYTVGDKLDTTGMVLRLYTNAGNYKDVTTGFSCDPTTLSRAGQQTIEVNYGSKSCTFTVTVEEKTELKSLSVEKLPDKTEYSVGESLNTTGLALRANYADKSESVTSGFSCTPAVLEKEGVQTVTVSFGGRECTFSVTVAASDAKETPAPEQTAVPEQTAAAADVPAGIENRDDGSSGRGSSAVVIVILVVAILALIGLGGYFYLTTVKNMKIDLSAIKRFFDRK